MARRGRHLPHRFRAVAYSLFVVVGVAQLSGCRAPRPAALAIGSVGLPRRALVAATTGVLIAPEGLNTGERADEPYSYDGRTRDGGYYRGQVLGLQPHCSGRYVRADGSVYQGEFRLGWRHGHGRCTWSSSAEYVGGWRDDRMDGEGRLVELYGAEYVGQWKAGKRHGRGRSRAANGQEYTGGWRNGRRHGRGVFTDRSGKRLECTFVHDRLERFRGTIRRGGDTVVGEWWKGGRVGRGGIRFQDGREYEGEWADPGLVHDDRPDGVGTMAWPNGATYTGEWKIGRMHGLGKLIEPDGTTKEGTWGDGRFTKPAADPISWGIDPAPLTRRDRRPIS